MWPREAVVVEVPREAVVVEVQVPEARGGARDRGDRAAEVIERESELIKGSHATDHVAGHSARHLVALERHPHQLVVALHRLRQVADDSGMAQGERGQLGGLLDGVGDGGVEVEVAQIEGLQVGRIREQAVGQRASEQVSLE
jgi:hypothetical protein